MPRRTSDWKCPQCKVWMMAKKLSCSKCGKPRGSRHTSRNSQRVYKQTRYVQLTMEKYGL